MSLDVKLENAIRSRDWEKAFAIVGKVLSETLDKHIDPTSDAWKSLLRFSLQAREYQRNTQRKIRDLDSGNDTKLSDYLVAQHLRRYDANTAKTAREAATELMAIALLINAAKQYLNTSVQSD